MVLTPAPHRHELDNTIHATFLYTTARLHPFSMQLPAVQEGQSMPEAVLLRQQNGSWERTRRAPRPQPDGGDAHRAMLPDHARYPPQERAARVRWPCRQRRSGHQHLRRYPPQAKKSTTGSLPPAVPLAITPSFRPWSHTSDDSYIYQLSLVLATATVSLSPPPCKLSGKQSHTTCVRTVHLNMVRQIRILLACATFKLPDRQTDMCFTTNVSHMGIHNIIKHACAGCALSLIHI